MTAITAATMISGSTKPPPSPRASGLAMIGKQRTDGGETVGKDRVGQGPATEADRFLGPNDQAQRGHVAPPRREEAHDIARRLAATEPDAVLPGRPLERVGGQALQGFAPVG